MTRLTDPQLCAETERFPLSARDHIHGALMVAQAVGVPHGKLLAAVKDRGTMAAVLRSIAELIREVRA